jgi:hypothetical protein
MVGGGDFPELGVWVTGADAAGVADGDVAVDLAVNEKDRDRRCGDGLFRRDFLHVEVIFPVRAEEGDFDQRTVEFVMRVGWFGGGRRVYGEEL